MRGLTEAEYGELSTLTECAERTYYHLDALVAMGRAEEHDHEPDGSYRMRPTDLGTLALRLYPNIKA